MEERIGLQAEKPKPTKEDQKQEEGTLVSERKRRSGWSALIN
jgi:hypothetical protein